MMVAEKRCSRCGEIKAASQFNKDKRSATGLTCDCKTCHNNLTQRRYGENRAGVLQKQRDYYKANKAQVTDRHRKWRKRRPGYFWNYDQNQRDPDQLRAHRVVSDAVRRGNIHKPDVCENCGHIYPKTEIHGHHKDYSKPLDVKWLCIDCHSALHRSREAEVVA